MARINRERLASMASRDVYAFIAEEEPGTGEAVVRILISTVRAVYRRIAPEEVSEGLSVFISLDGDAPEAALVLEGSTEIDEVDELTDEYRLGATVVCLPNKRFLVSSKILLPDACGPRDAIYHFHPDRGEAFTILGTEVGIETPELFPTAYGTPTFLEVDQALASYAAEAARGGILQGLIDLWRDERRLMFKPKPERGMRRSLENYLLATLRETKDVELRPEQTVDETHPVDLKVTYSHTNRLAYIEIKWLGDSAPKPLGGSGVVKYRDARAKSGAQQLVDYLDADKVRSHGKTVLGVLVVFDARRRGLTTRKKTIARADGFFYEHRDIEYLNQHLQRADFAPPVRMFMEPVVS